MIGSWSDHDGSGQQAHQDEVLHKWTRLLWISMLVILLGQSPVTNPATGAATPVEHLHSGLGESPGPANRYQQLEPIVRNGFDFPLICRVILGQHWSQLSAEQQQHFIERFTQISIATYAARFPGDARVEFQLKGTEPLKQGRKLIKTVLVRAPDGAVQLDYLVHRNEAGHWVIISVIAAGVNDLALKHSEYSAVMKLQGFDGLMAELDRQLAGLRP